jgi:hypothetical protein
MKLFVISLIMIFPVFINGQKNDNPKSKANPEHTLMTELKIIQLKIDSSLSHKLNEGQQLKGVYLIDKKNNDDNLFNIFSSLIGLLGLATAIGSIIFTYRSFQKEKSNRQIEFLSEIDKMLIDNPYLWTLYDTRKAQFTLSNNAKITQQELDGQLDAFCYYHLNNFELVFLYPSANKETRKTWKDYMVHLIVSSTEFRQILTKESDGYIYNEPYRKQMKDFLALAKKIIPFYTQYVANSISQADYYKAAREILK